MRSAKTSSAGFRLPAAVETIESHSSPLAATDRSHNFGIFAFLWALALLSHQIYYRDAFRSIFDVALTGSALLTLLNPYAAWRLLAVTGFHVLAVVYHLPNVVNHWFFGSLVSLTFVTTAVAVLIRNQRLEPASLFPSFALAGRLNLICLYYFSAFHKLNSDYFSLDVSCGPVTYGHLLNRLPFLPASDTALLVATWLGVIMELTLPTLLIMRRLRRLGVVLGLSFHLCLGLMTYRRFSMLAYALLVLFLPELQDPVKKATLLIERNASLRAILSELRKRKRLLLAVVAALGIILLNTTEDTRTFVGWLANRMTVLFFLAESVVLIAAALVVFYGYRFAKAPPLGFSPAVNSGLLATAFLIFSGISPYVGLKTLNAFSMYSNLRTEGGSTNHLFVPASLQVFSYQRDLIRIIDTNIASLQGIADKDMFLPYQQLRVEITKELKEGRKGIRVVFLRGGEITSTANAEDHPQLGEPVNAVSYKFLTFRAVERNGRRACSN